MRGGTLGLKHQFPTACLSQGRFGAANPQVPDDCKIYVALLPPHMEDPELEQLFSGYGQVIYTRIIKDRVTGNSKCYGFVGMANPDQVCTMGQR